MPNNGRNHRRQKCSVCEDLLPDVIEEIDTRMAAGSNNADIVRWLRQNQHQQPTSIMLNRHREQRHYLGDRTVNQSSDAAVATHHRDGINLMQRVQLNVAHVLLPVLALAPKKINTIEERQELYAFSKNQLAMEFEISQSTPEVYEHPVTGEQQLITPTSPNMLRLVKELRHQLNDIDIATSNLGQAEDMVPEMTTMLMELIEAQDDKLEQIESYMVQTAEIIDDEVDTDDSGVSGS